MQIVFDNLEPATIPNFKNGEGSVTANMYFDGTHRIMKCAIHPNSSIGVHTHETNCEVMFFISGEGKAVCDGVEEIVGPGVAHLCPKGSTHTLINTGNEDLVLFCSVVEC